MLLWVKEALGSGGSKNEYPDWLGEPRGDDKIDDN